MKDIRYMNVHDGSSCEREIYHRVRTPFMNFRYYFTHFEQIPIAIITTILIIIFIELLLRKKIFFILLFVLISFAIYCISYCYDYMNYIEFKNKIKNLN